MAIKWFTCPPYVLNPEIQYWVRLMNDSIPPFIGIWSPDDQVFIDVETNYNFPIYTVYKVRPVE